MRVRGFCCGWLGMEFDGLIAGESGRIRIPIPAYVIEHNGSVIVFDAGLHPDLRDKESGRYLQLEGNFDVDMPLGTDLSERLAECGLSVEDVDYLILSHLHFDHVGGSRLLKRAELVVQRSEWLAAIADVDEEIYMAADIDQERPVRLLDGEWDVYGDGRVIVTSTYGHTAGHQSLHLITDDGSELVLCGDACYVGQTLETFALPHHSFDPDAHRAVLTWFKGLEASGATLIFGHDPAQWPTGRSDDHVVELAREATSG